MSANARSHGVCDEVMLIVHASGKEDGPVLSHPGSRLHWFHMLLEPRWEDFKWTGRDSNRFAYLGNGFTTMEGEGRDLAWYMEDPDKGYEPVRY